MDTDRLTSPWARKLVAVVGVLLAANLVLAVVGPSLPEPVTYPTREVQLTVENLERMTAQGCADVLVTGNSVAAEGLSAQRLAEAWGLRSGVVSVLPGSIVSVDIDWMDRVTLPRAEPGTFVFVTSPLMFVPEEIAQTYGLGLYTRAVATRDGWPGDLHRWAVDHLPLIRHRLSLSDPETLVRAARDEIPGDYREVIEALGWQLEADGHIRSQGTWDGNEAFLQQIRDARVVVGDRWRIDTGEARRLSRQFDSLVERGLDVVVVIPPVTADLRAEFPGGESGFAGYVEAARALAGPDVTLVDLADAPYGDDLFRDTHHFNAAGSDRLTAEVAAAVDPAATTSCDAVG